MERRFVGWIDAIPVRLSGKQVLPKFLHNCCRPCYLHQWLFKLVLVKYQL